MKFLSLLLFLLPALSFANTDRQGLIGTYKVLALNYKHNGEPTTDHPWGKSVEVFFAQNQICIRENKFDHTYTQYCFKEGTYQVIDDSNGWLADVLKTAHITPTMLDYQYTLSARHQPIYQQGTVRLQKQTDRYTLISNHSEVNGTTNSSIQKSYVLKKN
ncbi:hypothetical protein [Bdellovibrio sp. NC01]|uniref:hypothetical protein n=1 Tax=Bdellovibrio sp. NC01 TaxID=2220073 RepID=UPI00115B7847|nr:hypothetical protein [Bdellovibrio sp. NC01]QDK36308.1 hypothetical protein DOE51_01180 [Bdellovibrio sp. NC01]